MTKTSDIQYRKQNRNDEKELQEFERFNETFEDPEIPEPSEEQLKEFSLGKEIHPEWFKPKKVTITIRIDVDVLNKYKSMGKGYQTRMNADLRKAVGLK